MAHPTPPSEVGLVGLGFYTLPIVDLCRQAGLRVAFVVDDRPEAQPGYVPSVRLYSLRKILRRSRVPVWAEADFFRRLERQDSLPAALVASGIENRPAGSVSTDTYLRNARLLREVSAGRRALLHPVALTPLLPPAAFRGRVALFGFPGSGNILAQQLLADLWRRAGCAAPRTAEHVAGFAEHYYVSTEVLLRQLLRRLRPEGMELIGSEFPTMDLTLALPDGQFAYALHVPSNRHLAQFFYHTHAIPSRLAVDEFRRLGAACFAVIRHPCEVVLSVAAKISRPPGPVLDHPNFLRGALPKVAEWHRHLLQNADRMVVVRYEDLVARRREPIEALAAPLGLRLSDAEVEALYDRYLHRDLLPALAPGHYYRGGNDKWKQALGPWHLWQFHAHLLAPVCARWGYELPPAAADAPPPPAPPAGAGGPTGQRAGNVPLDRLHEMAHGEISHSPYPLMIRSTSDHARQALKAALYSPDFLDHLSAGGLGPDTPDWLPAVPWQELGKVYHPGPLQQAGPGRAA